MHNKLALPTLTDLGNGRIGNINQLVDVQVHNISDGDHGMQHGVVDYDGTTYRVRRDTTSCNKNWFIYQTISRAPKARRKVAR